MTRSAEPASRLPVRCPPPVELGPLLRREDRLDRLQVVGELDAVDLLLVMTVEPGFGGQAFINNTWVYFDDTWELDVKTLSWTRVATPDAPSAREHAAAAFDTKRNRVVLFGGNDGGWRGQGLREICRNIDLL